MKTPNVSTAAIGFFVFHIGEGRAPHSFHNFSLSPHSLQDFQRSLTPGKPDWNICSRMFIFLPLWSAVVDWVFPGSRRYPGDSCKCQSGFLGHHSRSLCEIEPFTFPPGVVYWGGVVVVKSALLSGIILMLSVLSNLDLIFAEWSGIFTCFSLCFWQSGKHEVLNLTGLATMAWHFCRSTSLPALPSQEEMGLLCTLSCLWQSRITRRCIFCIWFPSRYRGVVLFFL